jgi:16S rRNA (guanine966-N2)-methyltransferase
LRIIAGSARGRRLFAPGSRGGESIRPTSDRAREALFNILGWETVRGAMVLDLFAGTGALGLEALSRGATAAVFVDNSSLALDLIHKNITVCRFADQARVIRHDLLKGLSWLQKSGVGPGEAGEASFDLIFLDPPYRQGLCAGRLTVLLEAGVVGDRARVIFEDDSSEELPEAVGSLRLYDRRAYGDTGFWLYETGSAPD